MKKKNRNNGILGGNLKSALYWQKKYLELQADCKDFLAIIVNLCTENTKNELEPVMVQFNEEHGYLYTALSLLRDMGVWDYRKKWLAARQLHRMAMEGERNK